MSKIKDFFCGFQEAINDFGKNLTLSINSILLAVVYFIGVGLASLTAKLFKKKFLETKLLKDAKTYWNDLGLRKMPDEHYYRQF